jgi:hypothetical protein
MHKNALKIKQCLSVMVVACALSMAVSGQTTRENTGWFAWFNSY